MLKVAVYDARFGRCSHDGAALNVRGLVIDHVIAGAGPRSFVKSGAHLTRDLALDLLSELALLELLIGPVQRKAQQRIAELIRVSRIKIHVSLAIRQVLGRQTDAGGAIPPLQRSLFPLRAPVRFASALGHDAERPNGRIAVAAKGDHA